MSPTTIRSVKNRNDLITVAMHPDKDQIVLTVHGDKGDQHVDLYYEDIYMLSHVIKAAIWSAGSYSAEEDGRLDCDICR